MFSRIARPVARAAAAVSFGARRAASSAATVARSTSRPYNYAGAAACLAAAAGVYAVAADARDSRAQAAMFGLADQEELDTLAARVTALQVEVAGKTNSAFVFIKPHAVNDNVAALVKAKLTAAGIRVTGEGVLDAETIDKNMLIDNHYGAIAAKAVKLKPRELNVPEKGQSQFKEAFGLAWDEAIAKGMVYNAADACEKLGISADDLDRKWSTLKRGTNLLKFGGGFYCGQVDGIFVMNGFYMSMRSAYTRPPAKLHFFTVQWPTDSLSWADFREKVLGATDPSTAEAGSLRRDILDKWQALGLASRPNVGDNGVHASASPFEALAERMNWMAVPVAEDPFGRGMLAAGVSEATIKEWATDPQVRYGGKRTSLFDLLEDLDADDVLAKVKDVQSVQ